MLNQLVSSDAKRRLRLTAPRSRRTPGYLCARLVVENFLQEHLAELLGETVEGDDAWTVRRDFLRRGPGVSMAETPRVHVVSGCWCHPPHRTVFNQSPVLRPNSRPVLSDLPFLPETVNHSKAFVQTCLQSPAARSAAAGSAVAPVVRSCAKHWWPPGSLVGATGAVDSAGTKPRFRGSRVKHAEISSSFLESRKLWMLDDVSLSCICDLCDEIAQVDTT